MNQVISDRAQILRSALELDRPLENVLSELAQLPWDSELAPVTLEPAHVIGILHRFKSGSLNAQDVETWANAIEGREDIAFHPESRAALKEAIFELANPDLQGALTAETVDRWIAYLSSELPKSDAY